MRLTEEIQKYLDLEPLEEHLMYRMDGSKYQPYQIIKEKLDSAFGHGWGMKNFTHFFFHMGNNRFKISGSVEVEITAWDCDLERTATRVVSGSATFWAEEYAGNEHWGATCKSLCVVNAVQVLGRNFGWGLNEEPQLTEGEVPQGTKPSVKRSDKQPVKMIPDPAIRKAYAFAVANNNLPEVTRLESIYDFQPL